MAEKRTIKYFSTRKQWRKWLAENFETANEIWFVFPLKSSGKKSISYNDAVEEALCFGWIDSTVKALDDKHKIQRFTPRKPRSAYSQSNKERLKWLLENGKVHPKLKKEIQRIIALPFHFPGDIMKKIKADKIAWKNYQQFSDAYKRIRIAYIEGARKRPGEFEKRLKNFISKTKANKPVAGFGGIEKYY
jgi:uncharacterized protein YdeI (YjbR/CyaY-like superfamily)